MNADYDYPQESVTYVVSVIPRKTGLNFPLVPSVRPKIYGVDIGSWVKSENVQSLLFKGTQANHKQTSSSNGKPTRRSDRDRGREPLGK